MTAQLGKFEQAAEQAARALTDHHGAWLGQGLQPCRDVGRLAHRRLRDRRITLARFADHHHTGVDAHTGLDGRGQFQFCNRLADFQRGVNRPGRVVVVGLRPAEIDHQAIAQVLRNMAVVARHHIAAGALVGLHQVAQVLRVELLGQRAGTDQVAEHDRDLPPLGRRCLRRSRQLGNRLEQPLAVAQRLHA